MWNLGSRMGQRCSHAQGEKGDVPRVAVVESQEAIHRELGAEVVVLAREHLLAHAGADLGLEVEDRAEAEVTALAALGARGEVSRPVRRSRAKERTW